MATDFEKKALGTSQFRKKMRWFRNLFFALLGVFFIVLAFIYIMDPNNAIGDGMKNIRYGLFSMGLIICGSGIMIVLLMRSRG